MALLDIDRRADHIPALAGSWAETPTFDDLIRDYQQSVVAFLSRMAGDRATAEDLAQETFIRIYEHLGDLRDPARARSWVFAIAANVARNHHRRQRIVQWVSLEWLRGTAHGDRDTSAAGIDARTAFSALSADDRQVLALLSLAGLTAAEVADILAIKPDAVYKRWQRARDRFLRLVGDDDDE